MLLNWLVRQVVDVFGWTPVGNGACLRDIEGPLSREVKSMDGIIASLQKFPGHDGTALVFLPSQSDKGVKEEFILIPRHTGYDYKSLIFTGIAVYVFHKSDAALDFPKQEKMLAIALLSKRL